jgi:perosamine synthetase
MTRRLAIDGGSPVRSTTLPYGKHWIDDDDIAAVTATLRSDWLTTGPRVAELEASFANRTKTARAVAVSSGTAALHAAMHALKLGTGDEVVVPAITFAASANAALYLGARPVFADVEPDTLLISPTDVARKITARTKAIVAVDYAGQPADYQSLAAANPAIPIIADACHAIGGSSGGRPVGSLATLSTFSLHPVKALTSGEGGVVTTDDDELAQRMRMFRNHGISTDHREREARGVWDYDMVDLGFNYRLSDIGCALAVSQLAKLDGWITRRRALAASYNAAFAADASPVIPLTTRPDRNHAYHLYVVRLRRDRLSVGRREIFAALRAEGIGVNVHYKPVYLHPYYQQHGYQPGACPAAEQAYEEILTLPLFPRMTDADADDVISAVRKVGEAYAA